MREKTRKMMIKNNEITGLNGFGKPTIKLEAKNKIGGKLVANWWLASKKAFIIKEV